MLALQ